jgi:hypothetical protein
MLMPALLEMLSTFFLYLDLSFNSELEQCYGNLEKTITVLSTADAEYIASAAAIQEFLWFWKLIRSILFDNNLGENKLPPTVLYNDNLAALSTFFDGQYLPHSRHVGVKYFRVRELVEDRTEIDMRYCGTEEKIADGLTKGLTQVKHKAFVKMCGLV